MIKSTIPRWPALSLAVAELAKLCQDQPEHPRLQPTVHGISTFHSEWVKDKIYYLTLTGRKQASNTIVLALQSMVNFVQYFDQVKFCKENLVGSNIGANFTYVLPLKACCYTYNYVDYYLLLNTTWVLGKQRVCFGQNSRQNNPLINIFIKGITG